MTSPPAGACECHSHMLRTWAPDMATFHRILVDNPQQLYGFQEPQGRCHPCDEPTLQPNSLKVPA